MVKKKLKFIHITKNAGTYVEHMAKRIGKKWGRNCPEYMDSGDHAHYFKKVKKEFRSKYDWFTIIRNPYTRILSEFNWYHMRVRQGNKDIFNYDIFKKNYEKLNRKNVKNFNITIRELIKNRDIENGNHFSEQYLYFDDTSTIHILRYENIKEEYDNLMKQYDLPLRWDHDNKINNRRTNWFSIEDFDNETINLINEVYKKDFEIFGYKIIEPK